MLRFRTILTAVFCLLALSPAWGLEPKPFRVLNLSPVATGHPLAVAESARLLPSGRWSAAFHMDLASHASINMNEREQVILDGQTFMTNLALRYGLNERLQLGLDLPWLAHDEGFLDNFISDWHDFFSLPDGDRNDLPEDQLDIGYSRNGRQKFGIDEPANGLGDLRLLLAWQMSKREQTATALQFALKAPTGSADDLTGSESWDLSLAITADHSISLQTGRAAIWAGLGGNWLGNGELADNTEDWAANAWFGAGWSPLDWLAFKLQLDGHTALFDSELDELGNPALILTMGGTLGLGPETTLDIGVGEDLAVAASPDVTFHLGLSHRF